MSKLFIIPDVHLKLDMIAVYKHFSADRGDYEEKRDYSDTINKIIARQGKLFG